MHNPNFLSEEDGDWPEYKLPKSRNGFLCIHGCKENCRHCLFAWGLNEKAKTEQSEIPIKGGDETKKGF